MKMCSRSILVAFGATRAASVVLAEETQVKDEEAAATTEAQVVATEPTPQVTNAVRAVRDKKTGKLRAPNPAELRKMAELEEQANATQQSSPLGRPAETVIREHAGGMKSAELSREHLQTLYGTRSEDGTIKKSHSKGDDDQGDDEEFVTE